MCLILFGLNAHPAYRLIVAANRDEFHRRPTAGIHVWEDAPIVGGRDLEAGGTWLGVAAHAPRMAAVTNVRDGVAEPAVGKRSRGRLPTVFLSGTQPAAAAAADLVAQAGEYAPVNLLVDDGSQTWWATNHPTPQRRQVSDGVHGLSNGQLDEPWPKLTRGTAALAALLDAEPGALLAMLHDTDRAQPSALPQTGVTAEMEEGLSAMFVDLGDYGTRASTILRLRPDGSGDLTERRFDAAGETGTVTLTLG
ncbi:MAG: NRDE family protein [Gordonia sp. (in: high G+C Gram-positive bacteria)]